MTFVWCFFITLLGAFCAWVKELSSVFSTELTCKTASDREYPCRHLVHCLQEALKGSWMIFWMCLWKKKCGGAGILFRGLFPWARKQLNCVDYLFTHTLSYTTWVLPYGFQSLSFMSTWKHCCRGFRWMLHVHSVGLHQQADNGFDHTAPRPPSPPPHLLQKRVTGKDELGQGNTEKTIKKIWQQ